MPSPATLRPRLSTIAATSEPLQSRAQALLASLLQVLPFDGAWMALADPRNESYETIASAELDRETVDFLGSSTTAHDILLAGCSRRGAPMSPSDMPFPAEELRTWSECLTPAGYREGLGTALFTPDGRHVAFLGLLTSNRDPPAREVRSLLERVAPVLGQALDPLRSLLPAARLVQGATAGAVLRRDGGTAPLPGLPGHSLLFPGSPLTVASRSAIVEGHIYSSFRWPLGGPHAPEGLTRVTTLASAENGLGHLSGLVILSPAGDLRGLTPRELEVLGLLIEGRSNAEIARILVVAPRTVAAHLEHILDKLSAPSRTLAAVRAEREGLYVPQSGRSPPGRPPTGRP